jgi:hypothetical protein
VVFQVWGDTTKLFDSGVVRGGSPAREVSVRLDGRRRLRLVVTDGGDGGSSDHADWASARLLCEANHNLPPPLSPLSWRMLALTVRNTDVTFTKDGVSTHVVARMDPAREAGANEAVRQVPELISAWNAGRMHPTLEVMATEETIRSVSPLVLPAQYGDGGFWVSPKDVHPLLDKYAPEGKYDSIFLIWNPTGTSGSVPCLYWVGPWRAPDSNMATFASICYDYPGPAPGTYPGEGLVHEWLHGATHYARVELGFDVPDPHLNTEYGHPSAGPDASWSKWYVALLSGTLKNPTTSAPAGFSAAVWAKGPPASKP